MIADTMSPAVPSARAGALESLVALATGSIPGIDCASITVRAGDGFRTVAASGELANDCDQLQYTVGEGPCVAAVTRERLVLVNDMDRAEPFSRYGPLAARRGVGSQAAVHLTGTDQATGLNLYAREPGAFDESTIRTVERVATYGAVLLGYAHQSEQLARAVDTRQDIGAAVGVLMERYGIDQEQAFSFLARNSQHRNVKLRVLARQVLDGTFSTEVSDASRTGRRDESASRVVSRELAAS